MIKIELPFRLPSLNEYVNICRNNKYGAGKHKKDIENRILWYLKNVKQKIDKPVFVKFVWYEKTKKRDKDNVAFAKKYILDALQKSGILPNDNNQYISGFSDYFVYGNCDKVSITLTDAPQDATTHL